MQLSDITTQTKNMIDDLKAICTNYGLGNASSEYKIITEVFLYKFLNDKFMFESRQAVPRFSNMSTVEVEVAMNEMSEDEYELLLMEFGGNTAKLKREHFISYLFNRKNQEDFHTLFDDTLVDIANFNIAIFSVQTGGQSKIRLFDALSQFVIEQEKKDSFCRAILDKIANCSFDSVFEQKYDFFATIFEYLIKDYNKDYGKYAEYYTPHSIASIIAKIMVPKGDKNVTVYDPAAGSGTLVLALAHEIGESNCTIYTQDMSQKSNEFLRLNLILNNLVLSLPNVVHDDTLLSPRHLNEKKDGLMTFDYIVSNPPFNVDFSDNRNALAGEKYQKRFFAGVPNIPNKEKDQMAIYLLFLQHIIFSLKEGGKAAVVVPTGFLTASKRSKRIAYDIRKHLIDNSMLKGVISMPANVFANTTTNVSILFIEKSNIEEDIRLIDASKMGKKVKEGKNQRTILQEDDIEKIINHFLNCVEEDKFSAITNSKTIKGKDYSFGVAQYFIPIFYREELTSEDFDKELYSYKNRIENLFNLNLICAEAVKKIYDFWFIQYDFPNENGLPYKSSGGKMVWSKTLHKEIPEGWEIKPLNSICDILLGGTPDTNTPEYWNGEIPWLSSGEIAEFPIMDSEKKITNEGMKNSATAFAKKGAVLLSITRYIRASILAIDACFNQSVVAVIPNNEYPTVFIYPFIETQIPRYMMLRTGAQQPHINKNTVEETPIAVPPKDIMDKYLRHTNFIYNDILETTRKAASTLTLEDFTLAKLL